jgi:hypothetical protein
MPKRLTTIRRSQETDRQLAQLCDRLGETAAEVQSRAVAELWGWHHRSIHMELDGGARFTPGAKCPWCGYVSDEA